MLLLFILVIYFIVSVINSTVTASYKNMPRTYKEDFECIEKYKTFIKNAVGTAEYWEIKTAIEKKLNPLLRKVTIQKIADCEHKIISRAIIETILKDAQKPMTLEQILQALQEKYDLWVTALKLRQLLKEMEIPRTGKFFFL